MGKAARARTPHQGPDRHARTGAIATAAIVLAAIVTVVVWQTGRGDDISGTALTHVHGLGINPADGALYVATHDGVFRLPAGGQPRRVGDGRQDTMGFTIAGPNQFLASGHPAPGQSGPPNLGLIESGDGAVTWTTRSLAGQADFHALRYRHNTVYGYNATAGKLITSTDKTTWQTRSTIALRDFEVHPTDPNSLLATTQTGLQRSSNAGTTWTAAGGPPLLLLAWPSIDRLLGLTTAGEIMRSIDAGTTWTPVGKLAGQVTSLFAHDSTLYASVDERGIFSSTDNGTTWTQIYGQP